MVVAQFDSIRCERIYKKLVPEVLRSLDAFLTSNNKKAWFTVFLATFLLLHQVAWTSRDRRRYTAQNWVDKRPVRLGFREDLISSQLTLAQDTRYGSLVDPLTSWVEEVHHGAVMLLAHWQYFKRCDLMTFNWATTEGSALSCLEPYQVEFVKDIASRIKAKRQSLSLLCRLVRI